MIRKIERDFVAADLTAVEGLLAKLKASDVLTAMSLEARRDELRQQLQNLADMHETAASAALFFSGNPVVGNRGIASEFGGTAVAKYQDIVSKVFALRSTGNLARRGVVPGKDQAKLHITNVVRGSFGFYLEELDPQADMIATPLKEAVDQATEIMKSFGADDDEDFVSAVEKIDNRVLSTVRDFFDLLKDDRACFRLVAGDFDKSFDQNMVDRAAERARATEVDEHVEEIDGQLGGVLPDGRMFEFRTDTDRATIRGKVNSEFPVVNLADLNTEWVGKPAKATILIRQVLRGGRVWRESFFLQDLKKPGTAS